MPDYTPMNDEVVGFGCDQEAGLSKAFKVILTWNQL